MNKLKRPLTELAALLIKKHSKPFMITTGISLIIFISLLEILMLWNNVSWKESISFLPETMMRLFRKPLFWLFISLPYLLLLLVRYYKSVYKNRGPRQLIKSVSFSFFLPTLIIYLFYVSLDFYVKGENFDYVYDDTVLNQNENSNRFFEQDGKYRGMHVFGTRSLNKAECQKLISGHVEQIVLVPYAGQEDIDSPEIKSRGANSGTLTRRDSLMLQLKQTTDSLGLSIIIKPHIWLHNPSEGKWRSDISMQTEEDWQVWEDHYRKFILHYAKIGEMLASPVFCIGAEFYQSVTTRPQFWIQLIEEVRKVYSGKLTYGANWDREFKEISFWDKLDYIGIQAYFPISKSNNPDLAQLTDGWDPHLAEIEKLAKRFHREVVFTEIGYKSTVDAAKTPWRWKGATDYFQPVSFRTQANCYKSFFECIWTRPWFKGAWLWQWNTWPSSNPINHNFSIKEKPAFYEMAKGFSEVDGVGIE